MPGWCLYDFGCCWPSASLPLTRGLLPPSDGLCRGQGRATPLRLLLLTKPANLVEHRGGETATATPVESESLSRGCRPVRGIRDGSFWCGTWSFKERIGAGWIRLPCTSGCWLSKPLTPRCGSAPKWDRGRKAAVSPGPAEVARVDCDAGGGGGGAWGAPPWRTFWTDVEGRASICRSCLRPFGRPGHGDDDDDDRSSQSSQSQTSPERPLHWREGGEGRGGSRPGHGQSCFQHGHRRRTGGGSQKTGVPDAGCGWTDETHAACCGK